SPPGNCGFQWCSCRPLRHLDRWAAHGCARAPVQAPAKSGGLWRERRPTRRFAALRAPDTLAAGHSHGAPNMRSRIVAGNWKLHGSSVFTRGLINELLAQPLPDGVELIVMPPFPFLAE